MTDDKPSLAERIEALADGGLNGIVYPQLKEPLYRIAAELREIAEEMREPWAPSMYRTTKAEGLAYADRLCHLWANRLAGKEGT